MYAGKRCVIFSQSCLLNLVIFVCIVVAFSAMAMFPFLITSARSFFNLRVSRRQHKPILSFFSFFLFRLGS